MAHLKKYTRSATGHILKHFERAKNESGEYISFGNQDIDPSRTHQNYNLAPTGATSQLELLHKRCSEVRCMKRDDVKVMCSWVVTLPGTMLNSGHEKAFFKNVYAFLSNRYGSENTVSAFVHMDEITPHLHFAFIPIVLDKKRGDLKVSAKEVVTKNDLQTFHQELDTHLQQTMNQRYLGGILNDATKDGNKSIEELKQRSASERMKAINDATQQVLKNARTLSMAQSEFEQKKGELEKRNAQLMKDHEQLEATYSSTLKKLQDIEKKQDAATERLLMLERNIEVLKQDRSTLSDNAELVKLYSKILEEGLSEPLPALNYLNLSNQDFSYLCLQGADLTGSILSGSDLTSTNLKNANLTGVIAIGTDFTDACLENIEYADADFSKAIFKGTEFYLNSSRKLTEIEFER